MTNQFNIQSLWDFSWNWCLRYVNFILPFSKLWDFPNMDNEKFFPTHLKLANKFVSTQNKINEYITFWKSAIKKIDEELWEYLKNYDDKKEIVSFKWTDPSMQLDNDFREIIEFCALRLQDVARLCLQINDQPNEILRSTNLVNEYERLLKERFPEDTSLIQMLDDDWDWVKMLKEMRNESLRHEWWNNSWREIIFHPVKIDFTKWLSAKPKLQIPTFEFNGSNWKLIIHDFEDFFDTLMYNIFDLSIDRLVLAYSKRSWMPAPIIKKMIKIDGIKEE